MKYWPSFVASIFILCLGSVTLALGTDYGQAWTAETARRLAVLENPVTLPEANLIDQLGKVIELNPNNSQSNQPPLLLVEFIYTRCPTVCIAMGTEFNDLQSRLISAKLDDRVKLLSISFDPRDNQDDLDNYLKRFAAAPRIWSAAKFERQDLLESVMDDLGVIVIPEPQVGFIHNAAVYAIKQGRVVAILDHNDREGIKRVMDEYASLS